MTHHSYLVQLNKEELKKNHIQISYTRNGRQLLVVGETYPFFMDSGFGSHEYIVVDMLIEQRHIDNPFELVYDIINKIVSDTKVILDWYNHDNSRLSHPAVKRLTNILKKDGSYKDNIDELKENREEYCMDIISDISVEAYSDKHHIDTNPDIGYEGICIEEFNCMNREFDDIDYISECQGILVILLGRNEVGMKFNVENVDWYGMDFNGYSRRAEYRISDITGKKMKIKRELNLSKELSVVLRYEKGWENVVRYYIDVIRKTDIKRADWIQGVLDKALKINKKFIKPDIEIKKYINPEFKNSLSKVQIDNLMRKTSKPYFRTYNNCDYSDTFIITYLPDPFNARTEIFFGKGLINYYIGDRLMDDSILKWMKYVYDRGTTYPKFESDFSKLSFVIFDTNMNIVGGNLVKDYRESTYLS